MPKKTYMYNVEIKFKNQENNVIMGIEGTDEDDVYNFIPCVLPSDVEYELINITLDEGNTPDMERKKQQKKLEEADERVNKGEMTDKEGEK